ncbi:MAG: ferritin family protein [Candidatus Omnitrophota bacterium]
MVNEALTKTLKGALEMEEKGYKFYKDTAKTCENNIAKKTFNFLADNELLHVESIKKFYNIMNEKAELPDLILDKVRSKRLDDLSIFSKSIEDLRDKVKQSDDDIKACLFAMEFEKNGYHYYENMLKDAKDDNLIKLLNFLLDEEDRHYESIMKLHEYISDSQNWYMYEEGSFPQG